MRGIVHQRRLTEAFQESQKYICAQVCRMNMFTATKLGGQIMDYAPYLRIGQLPTLRTSRNTSTAPRLVGVRHGSKTQLSHAGSIGRSCVEFIRSREEGKAPTHNFETLPTNCQNPDHNAPHNEALPNHAEGETHVLQRLVIVRTSKVESKRSRSRRRAVTPARLARTTRQAGQSHAHGERAKPTYSSGCEG